MSAQERETERLAALKRYHILDTPPEPRFDELAALASRLCGVPIALITLVDDRRAWCKAAVGLQITEIPKGLAFCTHTIAGNRLLVLPDTTRDERFHDNPLVVGGPQARFYAGAPLITDDGHALGTLCVMDLEPRAMTDEQLEGLRILGTQVVSQLELRRNLLEALDTSDELERRVHEHTRALRTEVLARRIAEEELRELSNSLRDMLEAERTRIAREVHDEFGQLLTALKIELACLQRDILPPRSQEDRIAAMMSLIDRCMVTVRRIATDLRPPLLDDVGLLAALEGETRTFSQRTGIPCELTLEPPDLKVTKDQGTALFRIVQEGLTNISRYAQARHAEVLLEQHDAGITLQIMDDGVGIDEITNSTGRKSLGLVGIRERSQQLGGRSFTERRKEGGTLLRVDLPPAPRR